MSDRHTRYWFDVYRTALRHFGVETKELKKPTVKSVERLRKEWNKQKNQHDDVLGVREVYRQQIEIEKQQADFREQERDIDYRTATADNMHDEAWDVIYDFRDMIERIHADTSAQIASAQKQEEGVLKEYAIVGEKHSLVMKYYNKYEELMSLIGDMLDEVDNNPEPVAEAIRRNGELDYIEGITLIPPSGIKINYENTIENLKAVWDTIVSEARNNLENNSGI